jgi:hypothetical protein
MSLIMSNLVKQRRDDEFINKDNEKSEAIYKSYSLDKYGFLYS